MKNIKTATYVTCVDGNPRSNTVMIVHSHCAIQKRDGSAENVDQTFALSALQKYKSASAQQVCEICVKTNILPMKMFKKSVFL